MATGKTTYKKMSTGSFWEFTYSPKHLDLISSFDRRPLLLFFEFSTKYKLIQGINFHFLTKGQRKRFIDLLTRRFKLKDGIEFGTPIKNLTYLWVKKNYPIALIAWRRYFPNRMRNQKAVAWTWDPKEIQGDVVNTDTQRIIGVTPEQIQKLAIRAMKSRSKTKVSKIRRKNIQRKVPRKRR